MIKKISILLLLIILTGCYNYTELNDLAIVTALGIDYHDNNYHVTIQVVNTKKTDENENNNGFTIYEANGNTLEEAIKNLSLICPKKIYLSHLEILIYGEEIALNGINDTLDYLLRNNSIRGDFYLFVAKNNMANNILKIDNKSFIINSESIKKLNETASKQTGKSTIITFYELANAYLNENKEIIIPTIEVLNKEVIMNNLAIFKEDKLVKYLNENKAITYNMLTNKIKESTYKIKCQDGYIDILINHSKTTIKPNTDSIDINVEINGTISSITCNLDLENENNIEIINKKISTMIENNIYSLLNDKIDIIGIKEIFYKNKINYPNNIKKNIFVNVNIIGKGNVKNAK